MSGIEYYFETNYDRGNLKQEDKKKFFGDLKDSYKANFLSHIKCYELLRNSKDEFALILEDDSIPEKIFYKNIQKYLKQLPKDFGLFFVSDGKNKFHIPLYLRKPFKKVYKKNNQPVSWGGAGASRMQMLILFLKIVHKYYMMNLIMKILRQTLLLIGG